MHDNDGQALLRIGNVLSNQLGPRLYRRISPLTVTAWEAPGEPVPFAEAVAQSFEPFAAGQGWSKPWGTTWFHITGEVPPGWGSPGTAVQLLVDLGFSGLLPAFQAEGLAYRPDGSIVKGIEPFNHVVDLDPAGDAEVDFYVEAASNPNMLEHFFATTLAPAAGGAPLPSGFASPRRADVTHLGDKATAGTEPIYTLRRIALVERDLAVDGLLRDAAALMGLMRELDAASPRRAAIRHALERMCDVLDPDDIGNTVAAAAGELRTVLASPAHPSAHSIVAVGHAHLDSAWLWPTRETVRKAARTFSNVLTLMDADPGFVFAASSAQQFDWVKQFYPALFERIRARVQEGRFIPVGGMWVESDTNMPGGEALVRQFLLGQNFFYREFGVVSREAWLPDSFGFTAALPQIARGAGANSFLTQKLSWNDTNRMPHHTFLWEGLDGSRIFTHFPPNDTYGSDLGPGDLAKAERQYAERGASNVSLTLFGWSDGGGGPTPEMLAAAHRNRDLEGAPRVTLGSPAQFFDEAKRTLPEPAVWYGEMYLEGHRGTYTSQARTKQGNRRSEHLLREAELWNATAAVRGLIDYPYEELESIWQTVLLLQFHDILPGSAIAWVHDEAEEDYRRIATRLEELIGAAQRALAGHGSKRIVFNAAPVPAGSVAALGAGSAVVSPAVAPVRSGDGYELSNEHVVAGFDAYGAISSFVDRRTGRQLIAPGAAASVLQIFRDTPAMFEAWDIDRSYRRSMTELRTPEAVEIAGDSLVVNHTYGKSSIVQRYWLAGDDSELQIETTVDWHEQEKLLKLAFPLDLRADQAASEIQFGHVRRPTYVNTSWDHARFETVAHRWVHVGEGDFGAVVANGSTYGHDITRAVRADGGTTTLVRESLLRGPKYPDPQADQGLHVLRTALGVAPGVLDAVAAGYRINLPARTLDDAGHSVEPVVAVSAESVLVEAVKLAEDRSGDLIVRLYEAAGARTRTTVEPGFGFTTARATDLLERDLGGRTWQSRDSIELDLRPFEIVTLRISPF
ncbi:glycosyl hydrolase-related protein [Actinoplanes sp. Pm04-4]|uniref:Glycosyl hydrolase-related protein n=1 Tax=Paractinoplanes pyxinae TaxID=2997416 RepID=A0ABT4AQI7_9ACTN|nr:glycoside hydrolase family 38 C-terminal domain-containing protein [Actinoplanes pyxinae]MCY1136507.1 glycosyl hydrolase-related protein [Actinoplanes pyxinae]